MPNSKVPNESKKIFSKNLKHYIDKSGKERATIANELGVAYTTFLHGVQELIIPE